MRRSLLSFAIVASCVVGACAAPPPRREVVLVTVRQAPPPPRNEVQPPPPGPRFTWVAGHWKWEGGGYVWEQGRWVEPREHEVFVRAFWEDRGNNEWIYHPGHWQAVR